jgi:hypothetical protein
LKVLKLIILIYIDNHNQIAKKPKQKLSLDNQYNQQNYQNHQQFMNNYQTNNFINNNNKQSIKRNGKEIVDSFSEDSNDDDDDESEIGMNLNRYKKGAPPSIISSELDTTTFFDTENDDGQ